MAIGVSYRGHDGKVRQFTTEGNPTPGSELDSLVRTQRKDGLSPSGMQNPLAEALSRGRRPQVPDPRFGEAAGTVKLNASDYRPGTLADKVQVDGSIQAGATGLCLKGDEGLSANGIYAKKDGIRAFLTLDDIDNPNAKGPLVGEPNTHNRIETSNKGSEKSGAFGVSMQSRTEAEVNEETGEVVFWEYTRTCDVTKGRRVGEISGETKRKICSFFLGSDRQITIMGFTLIGAIARSHFTDRNGKLEYEYWVKIPKWGRHGEFCNVKESVGSNTPKIFTYGETSAYVQPLEYFLRGAYPELRYGHYPVRPSDRPEILEFDSGRIAIDEFFEEKKFNFTPNDNCGCWTYFGGPENYPDGNFDLYGFVYKYVNSSLIGHDNVYSETEQRWIANEDYEVPYLVYESIMADRNFDSKEDLIHFLEGNGGLINQSCSEFEILFKGKVATVRNHIIESSTYLGTIGTLPRDPLVATTTRSGRLIKLERLPYGHRMNGRFIRYDTAVERRVPSW